MIAADLITIDDAVEQTGITPAEIVTHVELFRDPEPGVVRVSTRALENWVARKSALSALNGTNGHASSAGDHAGLEDAREENLAQLGRRLEQVAAITTSVRRASHVIATASAIVLLERLRRELVAEGERDNLPILGRVAWRLRSSLEVRRG
ncbi:MAG: hypothetical protein BMS9Abin37_0745 [Acidobacteriota bacterium]|nr:MAG: hypothetical protein BMS9Abin37_0745 [Acidobacteriota bacterium]